MFPANYKLSVVRLRKFSQLLLANYSLQIVLKGHANNE